MNLAQYIACGESVIAGCLPVDVIARCDWSPEPETGREPQRTSLNKTHRAIIAAMPPNSRLRAVELFQRSGIQTNSTFVQELSWLKRKGIVTAIGKPGRFLYSLDRKRMERFEESGQ